MADVGFLYRARRALLPLPLIDRPRRIDPSELFPPVRERPVPALEGKRLARVSSGGGGAGGGGAAVSLAGVARVFEEAGGELPEIVGTTT